MQVNLIGWKISQRGKYYLVSGDHLQRSNHLCEINKEFEIIILAFHVDLTIIGSHHSFRLVTQLLLSVSEKVTALCRGVSVVSVIYIDCLH